MIACQASLTVHDSNKMIPCQGLLLHGYNALLVPSSEAQTSLFIDVLPLATTEQVETTKPSWQTNKTLEP